MSTTRFGSLASSRDRTRNSRVASSGPVVPWVVSARTIPAIIRRSSCHSCPGLSLAYEWREPGSRSAISAQAKGDNTRSIRRSTLGWRRWDPWRCRRTRSGWLGRWCFPRPRRGWAMTPRSGWSAAMRVLGSQALMSW